MPIYKLAGKVNLSDIGIFFRVLGANIFRFLPRELDDLSNYLLEKVKQYVPVRTGTLKSSLIAEANINSIQVVAQSQILLSSEYKKEYAKYVEAGVFGKDMSKMIPTPGFGGPSIVRSPGSVPDIVERTFMMALGEIAQQTINGYAQFMRAGIYDAFPEIVRSLRQIIQSKVIRTYRKLSR